MILDLNKSFTELQFVPRGVIVIGAHNGDEVGTYFSLGFKKIILIEANPGLANGLRERYGDDERITIFSTAIANFNGHATLHVTNFDQSSSLLRLARHTEIYPTIHEIDQIEVNVCTLDHLFFCNSLNPNDFNFLAIDIQGAELLALEGATIILKQVEVVCCEFNRIEMYEGCALEGDLEKHLAAKDFYPYCSASPFHDSWGDVLFSRRRVYTMNSLGLLGRFGNQLFQYMFLRVLGEKSNAVTLSPAWLGDKIFDIESKEYRLSLPQVIERDLTIVKRLPTIDPLHLLTCTTWDLPNSDLIGYFQLHTGIYQAYKGFIKDTFRFNDTFAGLIDGASSILRDGGKKIIAIHLRRGDYGDDQFYIAPWTWYLDWIEARGLSSDDYVIYISSEEPEKFKGKFRGFTCATRHDLFDSSDSDLSIGFDFGMMVEADVLCVSNSTFSIFASLLNQRASSFARPRIDFYALAEFEPWNTVILESAKCTSVVHQSLFEADAADHQ